MADVREIFSSRTFRVEGILARAERTFKVTTETGEAQLTVTAAMGALGMPQLQDTHPEFTTLFAVGNSGFAEVGINQWEVTWFYEGLVDNPPMTVNQEMRVTLFDAWREKPAGDPWTFLPSNGIMVPGDYDTDIGGDSIDVIGAPTTVQRLTSTYTVTEYRDTNTFPVDFVQIGLIAGTRNNTTSFGAQIGTLLYGGATSRSWRNTIIALTHMFHYDSFFHLQQMPRRDLEGKVVVEFAIGQTDDYEVATNVYWRQPFNRLSNFGLLHPDFG